MALTLGGLLVGAFTRGIAFARKGDAQYVPRTECSLCLRATNATLDGIREQLATLLRLHSEEREARHRLANSMQTISNTLGLIQGRLEISNPRAPGKGGGG